MGWALFVVALFVFGLTFAVALAYLAARLDAAGRHLHHRAGARRRDPARGQGSLRHGGRADDVRLGRLRRPRARPRRRRRCGGSRRPGTRTPARRTCTSSPTASPRRTSTTGRCRTRPRPAARRAARAAARRRRSRPGSSTSALGTDSGGSIRIPAACCGIAGLQADVRARADRRRVPAGAELRPRRADGARRRAAASS